MLSGLLFVSCNNETVITDEVGNKQGEIAQKEESGEKKVFSDKENINQENKSDDNNKVSDELEYIVNLIEEVHPNPYKYVSKNEILEQGKEIFNQFIVENEGEYILYKRFLSLYKDPALKVEDLQESRRKLKVNLSGGLSGVYVSSDSENFKTGDKIVKIGGVPIEELIEIGMKYTASNTKDELFCNLDNVVRDFHFLLDAGIINNGKVKVEVMRDGISICQNISFEDEVIEYDYNNSYNVFDNNDIAVLDINSYKNLDEENNKIQAFFRDSTSLSVEKIVIDLRTDGHINMNIIDEIIKNLSYKNYYNYDKKIKKSSQWEESSYEDDSFLKKIFLGKKTKSKNKNSFIYGKEIFLLVDGNSGTDAIRVANLIKTNFYGKVIGTNPTSNVNNFGNEVEIELSEKKITLSVPTTEFIYQGKSSKRLSVDIYSDKFNEKSINQNTLEEILY